MKKLHWKKGIFSSKYKLFDHNLDVGEFAQSAFGNSSRGSLNYTKLKFKKKGFLTSETEIIELDSNSIIGKIKFNSWGNKAEITIHNKVYKFKYDNFWSSRWSISSSEKELIRYKSSTSSGEIESDIDNNALILCGLFVHNHYVLMMVIIAVSVSVILSSR